MKVLACIPAYNEGKVIAQTINDVLQYVDQVVVCDDGSVDDTSQQAKIAGAYVIRHEKNLGKGAALRSLFEYSKKIQSDIIITIDGDGQFFSNDIPKIIKPIKKDGIDLVIGNRSNRSEMPSYRKIGNKFLDSMTNMASELPFEDTQSGLRSYSQKAISLIEFKTDGFGADSEILVDASKKNLIITEVNVKVRYNTGEKTSTKNPVSHTGEVVTSLLELIAIKHPQKFLGIPGLILISVGIIFTIWSITFFNDNRTFPIPIFVSALGFLILGAMLMLMSVILYGINKLNTNS